MAPAMLAPAMMAKAEGIASTIAREMRQETTTLRINEDLDICGPNQKEAFSVTITPGLIATGGAIAIAAYIVVKFFIWASNKDPWANAPQNTQELLFGKLIGGKIPWP